MRIIVLDVPDELSAVQAELDELERIEHLMIMLKAGALRVLSTSPEG